MLDLIRKKQKSFIVKVVFWAIIATFVGTIFLVWGRGRDQGAQGTDIAVKVNGAEISFEEYRQTYSNLYRLYQNVYREKFTPELERQLGLRQQALDNLVDQTLLLQEAERMGLQVREQELVAAIAEVPAFQRNGAFDKNQYLQVLSYQRLTPEQFEAVQRRQLLVEKARERIQQGVSVTEAEIAEEFRRRNEKVNLAFVKVVPDLFEPQVEITEEALADYFLERQENFRLPEKVSLRYLQFDPARYRNEVVFEEGELEKYYRRHLDRFEIPEQVKASHILIKVPQDAESDLREKKQALAEEILEQLRAGEDFAELVRRHSDDQSTVAEDGDLGYFTRGAMVAPFEQAAFALQPGEISDVVETPFGFHIIKAEGYIEAGVQPLADVVDEVKTGLRLEKAERLAFEKAMDAYNINRKDGSLEAAAEANDLGIKETGLFSREGVIDGIGQAPEIMAQAFALKQGELARPVNLEDGVILFTLKERQPSRLPDLQDVRSEVEQAYRRQQAVTLAREAAAQMIEALKAGEEFAGLARPTGLQVQETDFFSRTYGAFVPKIGTSEELVEAAFELDGEQPVPDQAFEVGNAFVVVRLKERQEVAPEELDAAAREEIRTALMAQKQEEALNQKIQSLREQAEITFAPNLLATLKKP